MNKDETSHHVWHPGRGDLLRYADGELESEKRAVIATHLGDCRECSGWLADIETGVEDYRRTWYPELKASAPSPPPWFDVRQKMTGIDRKHVILRAPVRAWRPVRWAAAAAASVIGILIVQWSSEQKASAAELLRKASDRALTVSSPRRPIVIQTKGGSVIRPAVWSRSANTKLARDVEGRTESIRTLFETANYDWEDPLSARSFSAWRESLPMRREEVKELSDRGQVSAYEIRTSTDSGSLAEARLTLRASDLQPLRETLQFRNGEWVHITESATEPAESLPGVPAPAPPSIAGDPSQPPITAADELRVWVALHRAGADLGEPVEVNRASEHNAIVVTALGLSPERRRVLEQALSGIPRVETQFSDPKPVREPSRSVSEDTQDKQPAFQSKLEAQLGGQAMAENLTNRLLEASESSLARAHAIRKLADRFPPDVERSMTPADGKILLSVVTDHFQALDASSRRVVSGVRQFLPASSPLASVSASTWQAQAGNLLEMTQRVDALLTQLLAVPGTMENEGLLLQQLEEALARWQPEIAATSSVLVKSP
jgi:hypothetical protein